MGSSTISDATNMFSNMNNLLKQNNSAPPRSGDSQAGSNVLNQTTNDGIAENMEGVQNSARMRAVQKMVGAEAIARELDSALIKMLKNAATAIKDAA